MERKIRREGAGRAQGRELKICEASATFLQYSARGSSVTEAAGFVSSTTDCDVSAGSVLYFASCSLSDAMVASRSASWAVRRSTSAVSAGDWGCLSVQLSYRGQFEILGLSEKGMRAMQ